MQPLWLRNNSSKMLAKWSDEKSTAPVREWGGGWWKAVERFPCHTQNIQSFSLFKLPLTVPANFHWLSHPIRKRTIKSCWCVVLMCGHKFKVEIRGIKKLWMFSHVTWFTQTHVTNRFPPLEKDAVAASKAGLWLPRHWLCFSILSSDRELFFPHLLMRLKEILHT